MGERVTATVVGEPMVMLAVPTWERSKREDAVTMTVEGLGAVGGAV